MVSFEGLHFAFPFVGAKVALSQVSAWIGENLAIVVHFVDVVPFVEGVGLSFEDEKDLFFEVAGSLAEDVGSFAEDVHSFFAGRDSFVASVGSFAAGVGSFVACLFDEGVGSSVATGLFAVVVMDLPDVVDFQLDSKAFFFWV